MKNNILLVEPSYSNKYPPIGLMKISTYHKNKGDNVVFIKGIEEPELIYDKIYITTLFSFYYKKTLETIMYYQNKYDCEIYVGGILASLLTDKLKSDLSNDIIILPGLLTSSKMLGQNDDVNIDLLPLDYTLLYQTNYKYKENTGYISYITRGCTNKCSFCAVPKLEPEFNISNNIVEQINNSRVTYGTQKDLLLLDNNILSLSVEDLRIVVDQIVNLGYEKGSTFIGDTEMKLTINKIKYLKKYIGIHDLNIYNSFDDLVNIIDKISKIKSIDKFDLSFLMEFKSRLMMNGEYSLIDIYNFFELHCDELENVSKKYDKRKGRLKYVDFNQGMDARQLTEEKMKIISVLPIKPFRLAFDNYSDKDTYIKSIKLASKYGVKNFSNYLLYNFKDTPKEMYERLRLNLDLAEELNVNIYSFPMKYAPIFETDRKFVGEKWNKYYLANFRRILKPTMGIVGKGRSYFNRAFGTSYEDFELILQMPYDFVTYRTFYENNGLSNKWRKEWKKVHINDKIDIIDNLSNQNYNFKHSVAAFYKIRYKK